MMTKGRRYAWLQLHLKNVSPRVRHGFSAAIAERFLPSAKSSMSSWRTGSWEILRNGLDQVWLYLQDSLDNKSKFEDLCETAYEQVPHDDDEDWDGSHGVYGAGLATVLAIESILASDPKSAADASNEALEDLRQFIVFSKYGHLEVEPYFDEDEVYNTELIQREVRIQDSQLEELMAADHSNDEFSRKIAEIREFSKNNPIVLQLQ